MTTENGVYTPSPTPRPHPRLRPEAAEYAKRNKAETNWFNHEENLDYHTPVPKQRLCSAEASRNAMTNKGTLGDLMAGKLRNGDPDEEVHNRVKPEAEEYALRNRGAMDKLFDQSQNQNYYSPRPGERLRTEEAKKVAEVNKGVMGECMGGYADPPMKRTLHPRAVSSEAAEMAEKGRGGAMRNLIVNYGKMDLDYDSQGPKVKGYEAEENAERNKGVVSKLMNNYADVPTPVYPEPAVYYGGEEVKEMYQGKGMGPMLRMEGHVEQREPKISKLHQTSQGPGWDEDPPHVRSRPESDAVADRYHHQHEQNLRVIDMQAPPPTDRPVHVPQHLQVSETPRPQTSPVRTRPEARQFYMKNNSSEMGSIISGQCQQTTTPKKVNRMMMRSEDW
ncbi:hypothetical protein FSP39_007272 [Pinctada imbricata]|uniref:Uncharacterized protein n=1 Tax=Pinctada imbricata TaxID=66713 RepID=A0AA88XUK8_PINIB|nr:hypothetical protein FSP39_007272 [Pinctada imbricata]